MRRTSSLFAVTLLLLNHASASPGEVGADPESLPRLSQASETSSSSASKEFEPPKDISAAVAMGAAPPAEWEALENSQVSELLGVYRKFVVEQQKVLSTVSALPHSSPGKLREATARADLGALLSAAERLIEICSARGIEVKETREFIGKVRGETAQLEAPQQSEMTREAALATSQEVLRANLRPMTLKQAQARLAAWIVLLQQVCMEVRDLEISALESNGGDNEAFFSQRAVTLRGDRGRLIERVNIVIAACELKGGDESESTAYVNSVIATPPITGIQAAISTGMAWLRSTEGGLAVGLNALRATGILLAALILSRILGHLAVRAMKRIRHTSSLLRQFVASTVKNGVLALGVLVALSTLGVNMAPMLAAIGAAGLVVGLALQGTLGNLASGLMIMIFRPFDLEDIVDVPGANGHVRGMNLMTTEVRTFDNRTIFVPNSRIWGDVITNVTANSTRRVDMIFGISYGDDGTRARHVLEKILESNPMILADPEPMVRMHQLADSSVNFIVRPWAKTTDYWTVYWDITEAVKTEFDAQGISIPFPQSDVHLIPADPASGDQPAPAGGAGGRTGPPSSPQG